MSSTTFVCRHGYARSLSERHLLSIHGLGFAYTLPGGEFLPINGLVCSYPLFLGVLLPKREHDGVRPDLPRWHLLPHWHERTQSMPARQCLSQSGNECRRPVPG
jgi:hypothetical protein